MTMRHRWRITAACAAALMAAGLARGEGSMPGSPLYEGSSWSAYVDGGPSWMVGDMNRFIKDGWAFSFGFGPKFGRNASLFLDFLWSYHGLQPDALSKVGSTGGDASMLGITLNPLWRINPDGRVGGYVTGGGGYYHRTVQVSEPGVALVPVYDSWWGFGYSPYYDPFLGYTVAPASVITGRHNDDTYGVNAGLGLTFHPGEFVEIFLEARYHYVWTENRPTQFIPLVLGIRW
jgi:hypothetical protein